jgi:ubiquinone/menaquinone biosynthesis C-methylase UbiE
MITGQNINKVKEMYDTVAKEWAEIFSGEHDKKPKDQEILHRFSQDIGGRKPVWDFGCGPGNTTKYLKNLGVEISGLDLSEIMLEQARSIHTGVHFQKGNLLELEFQNDSIAGVVAFYAIVHFTKEQVEKFFQELFRVLQPGGMVLLTYHIGEDTIHIDDFLGKKVDIDFMFFTNEFITSCLEGKGFGKIETIERESYPNVEFQSRRAYVFCKKE